MGRGVFSGLFWGGVASMVALIVVSLYFPMRALVEPPAASDAGAGVADSTEAAPDRRILSDPPPPGPAAEVADRPPIVEAPSDPAEPAPELAVRPEDQPVAEAGPTPPVLPDTNQATPSVSATAEPTETPDPVPAPEQARPDTRAASGSDAPTPPTPTAPPSELAQAPSAIVPAPEVAQAPSAEPAPNPAELPTPDAADAIAAPARIVEIPQAQVPSVALPAPLPELPERPAGPVPPNAVGLAPLPDVAQIGTPAVIGETPMPDTAAAQSEAAPQGLDLPTFAGAPVQDAPDRPELRLSALTRPITGEPPSPRAAPQGNGTDAPVEDQTPAEAGEAPDPQQASRPLPERAAQAQPASPTPQRTLPRRIVVGGDSAPQDGVARLSARFGGSNRLPQIGTASANLPQADDPVEGASPDGAADDAALGALARNAQPWVGDGPRTAIVLEATGPERAIADILASISVPLTVALDPSWPDAAARASSLQAAGHEVLITMTGLPPRPQPRDIDVALNAHIARLPGAVGVFLPVESPISEDRGLLTHLAARLTQTGHGLVAEPMGLNVLTQIARAEGTALGLVDTVLGAQTTGALAARALDRAVFEASREGSFMVLGQTRADTLSALQAWTQEAGENLAPVSAILLENS